MCKYVKRLGSEPTYEDRLKEGLTLDLRQTGEGSCTVYSHRFTDIEFRGLNISEDSYFKATMIDETNAFTLNINGVAIIPLEFFKIVESMVNGKSSMDDVKEAYERLNVE